MSVPASSLFPAAATAIAACLILAHPLAAEPLKTARLTLMAGTSTWSAMTAQAPSHPVKVKADDSGRIASAVAPLDLRKLSMADFGDVDGAR